MHHHHALALLLFSIIFAAFALFTLCTFAPKAHHASLVNNNPGDAQINALAGLPIRRRSEDDGNDSQLFVRDGIFVNYRGYGSTMKPDEDINHTLSISSMEEASSVEKVKAQLYRQCAQHLRFFDSPLPLETTVAGLGNDGILSRLFTAATLLKRDHQSLPNACIEFYQHLEKPNEEATTEQDNLDCDQDEEGRRVGVYFEEMPVKREVDPSLEKKPVIKDKDQQPTGEKENVILTKELSTPEEKTGSINNVILTEEKKQGAEQPKKKHSEVTVDTHRTGQRYNPGGQAHPAKTHNAYQEPHNPYKAPFEKRDAQNVDLLGAPLQKQKKKVIIDFKKAQRDAQLADLADGFLIETEYLTPGRKVVQHLSAKPGTRTVKLHFEGEKLVLDDPASANTIPPPSDAQEIMDNVLAMHDDNQQQADFIYLPQMSATMPVHEPLLSNIQQQSSPHRYDLVKRSRSPSPVRRTFRFDRRV